MTFPPLAPTNAPGATVTIPISPVGSQKGFTLLELIVVMLVLAAVSSITYARLMPAGVRIETEGQKIINKLQDSQRKARLTGEMQIIELSDLMDSINDEFELIDLDNSETAVFYPLGHSNGIRWRLKNGSDQVDIEVNWLDGRAHIDPSR